MQVKSDVQGRRIAAGVLGILLGSLGIHKFIIGKVSAGLIMLIVTVLGTGLGFLCFPAFAAAAMQIIGIIEGIFYLTKTDEEFERLYIDGDKSWF
ncbi:MAG: NINE protein [Planctomycetota bacterium]